MLASVSVRLVFSELCSLGRERQWGGRFHLELSTPSSPIVNKYREGKVQSTLERELKVPELVACQASSSTNKEKLAYTQRTCAAVYTLNFLMWSNNSAGDFLWFYAISIRCS